MNIDFSEKKLLILGAYTSEIEIINAAKKRGIYTIVTDNHTDWNEAPAKFVSDEAWNISWSDLDALEKKCKQKHIDGCIAGFSENRIICAQNLSERLGIPFYTNGADLATITNKKLFKQSCTECDITVPKTFSCADNNIAFPVIVKPADNGGSRGITICYSRSELIKAIETAQKFSPSKSTLIEEYMSYDEVMIYFTVHNGIVTFSAMCDRLMYKLDKSIIQIPIGYYYPSKHLKTFIDYNLEKYKRLIESLKISNGLIAFQAFIKGIDAVPFDPTYRLDGTMAYHMIEQRNRINVLDMLISYSFTSRMGEDDEISQKENPYFENPTFELPILLGRGTISSIIGLENVKKMDGVVWVFQIHKIGDTLQKDADFSQMLCRIQICATEKELKTIIDSILTTVKVYNEKGEEMIIGREYYLDDWGAK